MQRQEVLEILTLLREAADTLSKVRKDLGELSKNLEEKPAQDLCVNGD